MTTTREHGDTIKAIPGADPRFQIKRTLDGYAYAANANVPNPTPRYWWTLLLDGEPVDQDSRRTPLVDAARIHGQDYIAEVG